MHRICFVGNFEKISVGEPEVAKALEEQGHKVFRLQEREVTLGTIQRVIEEERCDVLLYAKFRVNNSPLEIQEFIDSYPIPKVCWVFDLYWGLYDTAIYRELFTA